jgi:hypothetical protein
MVTLHAKLQYSSEKTSFASEKTSFASEKNIIENKNGQLPLFIQTAVNDMFKR